MSFIIGLVYATFMVFISAIIFLLIFYTVFVYYYQDEGICIGFGTSF